MRLAKLRGTPGLKEDKIAETERDVNEADQRLRNAKLGCVLASQSISHAAACTHE